MPIIFPPKCVPNLPDWNNAIILAKSYTAFSYVLFKGTKRNYIQKLLEQSMDIQAISRWVGALTGYGGCKWDIGDYVQELTAQRSSRTIINK